MNTEKIVILKKDWPPFPKGTEFKIKKGLADEMLYSPTFGELMPNGQKANGMIPRHWTEYIRHFDHVGGFDSWFEKKHKTKEEELQSQINNLETQNKDLRDLLAESGLQIEYLHNKFKSTGSGNNVLLRIEEALLRWKS